MTGTAHVDTFARDHLPPRELWPELLLDRPEYRYPERLNAAVELLDRQVEAGGGERRCLVWPEGSWTYREVLERVNRLANVLVHDLHVVPGNRVLLRGCNGPMLATAWLAVLKAGAIAVTTMPLLRAAELHKIIDKARVSHALCDARLGSELERAAELSPLLGRIRYWGQAATGEGLEGLMEHRPAEFEPCPTFAEDVALIAFTSGTTGQPKGTMHFHRDVLAIGDAFSAQILKPRADDLFTGSPPLGFTYGLGGLLTFPLRAGAATLLLEAAPPETLVEAIPKYGATVLFTAPTAYRVLLGLITGDELASLRRCVSAGETLPEATWRAFHERTGLGIIDGIGATELLHIFISAADEDIRPGATGKPVPGYVAKVLDIHGHEQPPGTPGRLAVKGPTGCRYLADAARQRRYVHDGWNMTGDTYVVDADGYFHFIARSDDMIVSAGYNIAGPEVEAALLKHEAVQECGVVGAPDEERGQIVQAYVVLKPEHAGDEAMVKALQEHVKATIAPYKYPRAVTFVDHLPKTQTGKLQRYRLRELAREGK